MSPPTNELNLALLPSDIVRRIIRMGHESFDKIRMVSPRWRNISALHLNDRKRLPVINRFAWNTTYDDHTLNVSVASRHAEYFGLSQWKLQNRNINEEPTFRKEGYKVISDKFSIFLSNFFARCSVVEKVDFSVWLVNDLLPVRSVLGDVKIHEILFREFVSFNSKLVTTLTDMIRIHSIGKVVVDFGCLDWSSIEKELARFCRVATPLKASIDIIIRRYMDENEELWKNRVKDLATEGNFSTTHSIDDTYLLRVHIFVKAAEPLN